MNKWLGVKKFFVLTLRLLLKKLSVLCLRFPTKFFKACLFPKCDLNIKNFEYLFETVCVVIPRKKYKFTFIYPSRKLFLPYNKYLSSFLVTHYLQKFPLKYSQIWVGKLTIVYYDVSWGKYLWVFFLYTSESNLLV